jgi:O-antigen ligase
MGFMGTSSRLSGLIEQPNLLGVLIALGAFPMAGWLIRTKNLVIRWLLVGCLLVMALAIVLTISRGTYIAVAIGFVWWIRRSIRLALALTLVLGGTYLTMTHYAQDRIDRIERRLQFEDSSVVNRGIVAKNALRAIAEAPFLGIGYGQFGQAHAAVNITREIGRGTHNFYLGTAASTGLPALLLFLAFLFSQARRIGIGLKNARNRVADAFDDNWARYEWAMALFQTLMLYHTSSLMVRGAHSLMEWTFFSLYAALAAVAVTKKSTSEPAQSSAPLPAE